MSSKQFHLLGESPSSAVDIDLAEVADVDDLQHLVAAHFNIVDHQGKN